MLTYKKKKEIFTELYKKNKLHHAYLFFGGPSSKKFNFAVGLANLIEHDDFDSKSKTFIDTKIITVPNDKKIIGINETRNFKNFLSEKPINGGKRIVIINSADDLSHEAAPSLLKIVEEPPKNALIIFLATSIETLPQALSSRLIKIFFSSGKISEPKKNKTNRLAETLEKAIIKLYLENPVKNSHKISLLLKKAGLAKRLNLNEKIQLKSMELILTGKI